MASGITHFGGIGLKNTNTEQPTVNGEIKYVTGTGFRMYSEGTAYTIPTSSGGTTAYDDIGDPDANGTIAFAGYTNTWTSTLDTGSVFTISNSDAALSGQTNLVDLKFTDDGSSNGYYLRCLDNAGGDVRFSIGKDGMVDLGGEALGTTALNIVAGDVVLNSGDLAMSGTLYVDTGNIELSQDNIKLTLGASGATDSYLYFDGAGNLVFYDSNTAAEKTLTQLLTTDSNPTMAGDITFTDGKLTWTDAADEQAGTWTFANTTSNDIAWSSAATTGNCLSVTANALTSGSMIYLASSAAGMAGEYIRCYDGAADDFVVGAAGAVTVAGTASTDSITLVAGDVQITAGDIDMDLGIITIDNTADEGNKIARNNATGTAAVLEIEETHATGGINLLLDTKNTTASEYNLDMTSSGATQIHLGANGAAGDGILIDATDSHTGQFIKIDAGPWLGTAGEGAALDFRSDSGAVAEAGHAIYLKMQGTTADAAAIDGKALYAEDEAASTVGSYLVNLDSANNGALHVTSGTSLISGDTIFGTADGTGNDVTFWGDTAGSYLIWDQSEDELRVAGPAKLCIGGTPGAKDGLTIDFDGANIDIDAVTANDNIIFGSDVDTNLIVNTASGAAMTIDHGAETITIAATAQLIVTGDTTTGAGLSIPGHASNTPNGTVAHSIFFEDDAKKLWIYNPTSASWEGVVLA